MEVAVEDPQPAGGEQVRVIFQGLIQQRLLGFSLVPAAAGGGTGRAAGHGQGGAGGGVRQPQVPLLGVGGEESSAVPAEPNACRFAGVSGTRVSDPSMEQASRSPAVTAR